jgi:hypothetical protein
MYFNSRLGVYVGDKSSPDDNGATPAQISAFNAAIAASDALRLADKIALDASIVNPVIQYLVSHTPAECVAKVNSDVTDLASAKIMLGHFAVALCVLAKDKLRA